MNINSHDLSSNESARREVDAPLSSWVTVPRFLYSRLGLKRGVGRAVMMLARHNKSLHAIPARLKDGRIMYLDLRETMCMSYLLVGDIWMENGPTMFVRAMLKPGEAAIDIGANVGWYSTLFSELVGAQGKVYGFEPNEKALKILTKTAGLYPQLEIVPSALGDSEGEVVLHIPGDGGQGSIEDLPGAVTTSQRCRVTTLDNFLGSREPRDITFIKCDAEGAEFRILRGASSLLKSEKPPIWLMEISVGAAKRFGYHPDDILDYFDSFPEAGYRAFIIEATAGTLRPLERPITIVRNDAVFIPRWQEERLNSYLKSINQVL